MSRWAGASPLGQPRPRVKRPPGRPVPGHGKGRHTFGLWSAHGGSRSPTGTCCAAAGWPPLLSARPSRPPVGSKSPARWRCWTPRLPGAVPRAPSPRCPGWCAVAWASGHRWRDQGQLAELCVRSSPVAMQAGTSGCYPFTIPLGGVIKGYQPARWRVDNPLPWGSQRQASQHLQAALVGPRTAGAWRARYLRLGTRYWPL